MFQIKIYINRLKVPFKNKIIPTFLVDSLTDLFIFILIHLLTDESGKDFQAGLNQYLSTTKAHYIALPAVLMIYMFVISVKTKSLIT